MASFEGLPTEILHIIFSHFDSLETLHNCSLSCTSIAEASRSSPVEVYRSIFCNAFDDGDSYDTRKFSWVKELRQRTRLLRHAQSNEPDLDLCDLQSMEQMLLNADMSASSLGRNGRHLSSSPRLTSLILPEIEAAMENKGSSSTLQLYYKVCFLMLACPLGALSDWERRHGPLSFMYDPELSMPHNVFRTESTFSEKVHRKGEAGGPGATIICAVPPVDFAGARSLSSPNWRVLYGCLKVMRYSRCLYEMAEHYKSLTRERPVVMLHSAASRRTVNRRVDLVGYYVYINRESYPLLFRGQTIDTMPRIHTHGEQYCNFVLHPDGSVTGEGDTWPMWSMEHHFTVTGIWTNIQGCPAGFKRVAYIRRILNADDETRYLYDGILVPGSEGYMYVGRWTNAIARDDGDVPGRGPFLFWSGLEL